MSVLDLGFWFARQRTLGVIAIIIGAGAWGMEFAGTVYICPYCRVQRTVILLLGIMMVLPFARHWTIKYLASVMGFMGARLWNWWFKCLTRNCRCCWKESKNYI